MQLSFVISKVTTSVYCHAEDYAAGAVGTHYSVAYTVVTSPVVGLRI